MKVRNYRIAVNGAANGDKISRRNITVSRAASVTTILRMKMWCENSFLVKIIKRKRQKVKAFLEELAGMK